MDVLLLKSHFTYLLSFDIINWNAVPLQYIDIT